MQNAQAKTVKNKEPVRLGSEDFLDRIHLERIHACAIDQPGATGSSVHNNSVPKSSQSELTRDSRGELIQRTLQGACVESKSRFQVAQVDPCSRAFALYFCGVWGVNKGHCKRARRWKLRRRFVQCERTVIHLEGNSHFFGFEVAICPGDMGEPGNAYNGQIRATWYSELPPGRMGGSWSNIKQYQTCHVWRLGTWLRDVSLGCPFQNA